MQVTVEKDSVFTGVAEELRHTWTGGLRVEKRIWKILVRHEGGGRNGNVGSVAATVGSCQKRSFR